MTCRLLFLLPRYSSICGKLPSTVTDFPFRSLCNCLCSSFLLDQIPYEIWSIPVPWIHFRWIYVLNQIYMLCFLLSLVYSIIHSVRCWIEILTAWLFACNFMLQLCNLLLNLFHSFVKQPHIAKYFDAWLKFLFFGFRHLDNLLLRDDGRLFHVDFGFILGRDPKPFPPPMKLCKEMVEAMGGAERFLFFCAKHILSLCAFIILVFLWSLQSKNDPDLIFISLAANIIPGLNLTVVKPITFYGSPATSSWTSFIWWLVLAFLI